VLIFSVALAVVSVRWYSGLRERTAAQSVELRALETRWAAVSAHLQEAAAMRPKLERALGGPARFAADRASPRWTPALRGIAMAAGKEIELVDIHAHADAENPSACVIRVRGLAGGPQPRLAADHFRKAAEENLKRNAGEHPVLPVTPAVLVRSGHSSNRSWSMRCSNPEEASASSSAAEASLPACVTAASEPRKPTATMERAMTSRAA
jgi:hypothetical protein